MDRRFKFFLIASVIALLALGTVAAFRPSSVSPAYVNTEEIYNNFDLKKRLEAELKRTQEVRQSVLDSIRFQVEQLALEVQKPERKSDSLLNSRFVEMRESYFRRQQEYEESNSAMAEQYTAEIWSQLNTYIKEYGEEEGYSYIFGASGDGALMYADDAVNITTEVNGYVNERFNGK